jgi:hypothetical protein
VGGRGGRGDCVEILIYYCAYTYMYRYTLYIYIYIRMQGALSSHGAATWVRILQSDDSSPLQSLPAARAHAKETLSGSNEHATHELALSSSVHTCSRTSRATSPGRPEKGAGGGGGGGGGSRGNSASPQKPPRRKTRSTSPVKVTFSYFSKVL